MIYFPNLNHNSPPKQMFVYKDKKEFVYVVDLEVLICMCQLIELCDNTRNSNFIKKIISFLIFLFAKHGFEM